MTIYYKDTFFLPRLLSLVIPIILQGLLTSSLNFIDVFMIGQLGETAVAAVGSVNQFMFVFLMLAFGLSSGTAIFTAQYWGAKQLTQIKTVMGLGLLLTLCVSVVFTMVTMLIPGFFISPFTNDPHVLQAGIPYLKIIAPTFIMTGLTFLFASVLRSTENVVFPMSASIIGIVMNTGLNYLLIFGKLGFPELGITGAAIATLIARIIETGLVIFLTYYKKSPAALTFQHMFSYNWELFKKYLQKTLPIVGQSVLWALGFSVYSMVYGHLEHNSTGSLAAFNISGTIERICLVFFTSLGGACSIMVGNRIGANEENKARGYAKNFLVIALLLSVVISVILFLLRSTVVDIYKLTDDSKTYIMGILLFMSLIMWAKASNIVFHMGIFKAGGDTLFSMFVDVGGVWLIGVPIALIAGFVIKLPVHYIVACLMIEDIVKMAAAYFRFLSGKWLNNLI